MVRAETASDGAFLDDLTASCSPLAGLLPDTMIRQQGAFQRIGHDAAYPAAMRRLVLVDGQPAGHVVIDWGDVISRCVDIAVLPAFQARGIGTAMLSTWLRVCTRLGLAATLSVRADNPAIALYRRLGFAPGPDQDGDQNGPMLAMIRPA